MAANEEQGYKRTPFSAKLPQVSLDDALEPARALAELAAPATPHVIAQHLGTSYGTNARFRTRTAAAGYYGLIAKQGNKRVLTERGKIITSGGNGDAAHARREAVISTSFGPLILSLRGRPVNESAIMLRLQSDFNVPDASAASVATALIDAATQAGLITDDRFDAAAIEAVASAIPSEPPTAEPLSAKPKPEADGTAPSAATTKRQQPRPKPEVEQPRPFVPGVQVVVKVDASNLTPAQIAELVHALQRPPA
jgi:hypothetical protein